MSENRPQPEALRRGDEPAVPRPAATVLVLRDGDASLEVLMVQRTLEARFMAGYWVFPGGAVDPGEEVADAARRELLEEVAIVLETPLVPFGRWVTPPELAIRFDTWFFVAAAPAGADPRVDGSEIIAHRWVSPEDALSAQREGTMVMALPTIKTLQTLTAPASVQAALSTPRETTPVTPRVVAGQLLLPGEDGYPS